MFGHFKSAIVRKPGNSYLNGLTQSTDGKPDLKKTLAQHASYCNTLSSLGVTVHTLEADEQYPDGCFVEDTAIVTPRGVIITRPGAASRSGETTTIEIELRKHYSHVAHIEAPGCVDGGDILETDSAFIIGISARTNPNGAQQLQHLLADLGYPSNIVDVRACKQLLHFKTGVSALGEGLLVMAPNLPTFPALSGFDKIILSDAEQYAANCIVVNEHVIIPSDCPLFKKEIERRGMKAIECDMSEFKKMDGGLSCLSLRLP
jgi:dimethylargininase